MAITLTNSYKYIGRSNAVSCPNGWKYYILLYAKTSPNTSTGKHKVTVKQILACTNDATFHNWDTTGYVKVAETNAFSWSNARVPLESWSGSSSLTAGDYTYKRHTTLKEGSVTVDTAFAEDTITLSSYWKMEDSNSAGWFPYKTEATISEDVILPAIATASTMTYNTVSPKMGSTLRINIHRSSTALTHTLTYAFGTKTGTIATGVGTLKEWTVPDLAVYCDNALSGDLKLTCKTYSGSTLVGSTSRTITLYVQDPTVPTVSETSADLGTVVKVSTPKESSNFTHLLKYSFGGKSYDLYDGYIKNYVNKTFPLSLASNIPTKTSDICTITCETYNGTAKVGTKTVTLTLKVPDNETTKPTFTYTLAPSPNDVVTSGFVERLSLAGKYIRGKSKLVATFDAESTYSTIASYSLKVDGATKTATTGPITSDYIVNYYGTLTVTLRVTDARGYYTEVKDSIRVLNWFKPYIDPVGANESIVCERQAVAVSDENTVDYDYLYIAVKRVYAPMAGENVREGSAFTQGNLCTLRYCYKKVGESVYGDWVNLLSSGSITTDEYVGLAMDESGNPVRLEKDASYDVWLQIYDATNTGTPIFATVSTDYVTLHLGEGGKKAAFGKYAEEENALEIAEDWKLHALGDAEVDGVLTVGGKAVSAYVVETGTHASGLGTLRYRIWSDGTFDFWGTLSGIPTSSTAAAEISGMHYSNQFLFTLPFSFSFCIFTASGASNYIWVVNCAVTDSANKTLAYRLLRSGSLSTSTTYTVRVDGHGTLA